jgi:hypothetical protein
MLALLDAVREHGLPLIAGWDVSARAPLLKLYANASDVSTETRARVARGIEGVPRGAAPHVLGLNVAPDGATTTKLYEQRRDVTDAISEMRAHPSVCVLSDLLAPHAGGVVICRELEASGALSARAFFVALRPSGDALLDRVPGFDRARVRAALPFEPAPCRSIGVDVAEEWLAWTAYVKPAGTDRPVWTLEPAAVFRAGDAEVGIFVEHGGHAPNAYARTAAHAISYRVRHGTPLGEDVERLAAWVVAHVERAEREGLDVPGLPLTDPPAPWSRVAG